MILNMQLGLSAYWPSAAWSILPTTFKATWMLRASWWWSGHDSIGISISRMITGIWQTALAPPAASGSLGVSSVLSIVCCVHRISTWCRDVLTLWWYLNVGGNLVTSRIIRSIAVHSLAHRLQVRFSGLLAGETVTFGQSLFMTNLREVCILTLLTPNILKINQSIVTARLLYQCHMQMKCLRKMWIFFRERFQSLTYWKCLLELWWKDTTNTLLVCVWASPVLLMFEVFRPCVPLSFARKQLKNLYIDIVLLSLREQVLTLSRCHSVVFCYP